MGQRSLRILIPNPSPRLERQLRRRPPLKNQNVCVFISSGLIVRVYSPTGFVITADMKPPKRPPPAYMIFFNEYMKEKSPSGLNGGKTAAIEAGKAWSELPEWKKQVRIVFSDVDLKVAYFVSGIHRPV